MKGHCTSPISTKGRCIAIRAIGLFVTRRTFSVSSIRVKKFCATTAFSSDAMLASGFKPPFTLQEALKRTVEFEFIKKGE